MQSQMERRRAQMIDITTGQPIDPAWMPMLAIDELEPANARMAHNNLAFAWRWVPGVMAITGAAVLSAAG